MNITCNSFQKVVVLFIHRPSSHVHPHSTLVHSVLPDVWPSVEGLPNNIYNTSLFEQLYTLAHVLLTDNATYGDGSAGGNRSIGKSQSKSNGVNKNSVADVESYPVMVGYLFTHTVISSDSCLLILPILACKLNNDVDHLDQL